MRAPTLKKARASRPAQQRVDQRRVLAIKKGSAPYQERRREIAKAAAEVFNKQGFRGTSLGAVADALGTSRASLYYYIASKRELFDELVREAVEENVAAAEKVRASDAPAIDKLRTLMVDLMRSNETHYPLFYIYIRENLSHVESKRTEWSRHMRDLNRRYEAIVISIIQDGITDGSIRPIASPRIIFYGLFAMLGWTHRWYVPHRSLETAEGIGTAFAELALNGLNALKAA